MKKFIVIFIFSLMFLTPCTTSNASPPNLDLWFKAYESEKGTTYFYIPDIVNSKKIYRLYEGYEIISIWTLGVFPNGTKSMEKTEYYLNPYNPQSRTLQWTLYDKNGKVQTASRQPTEWFRIIPETIREANYNLLIMLRN